MIVKKAIKRNIRGYLILCGLLSLTGTLQAAIPSQQLSNHSATTPLPPDQLLIPANGQCLYTSVIMGYLLPIRNDVNKATERIDQLFGMQPARCINELYQTLESPTDYLTYLHSDTFGRLVTDFMIGMKIKKGTWGGPLEIQTIANKLKVDIQEYYPDPSNPTTLLISDLTTPAQANTTITLHIVRDKVHPNEVLTQIQRASAQANQHYQHYRLKYTLPSPLSALSAPSTHSSVPNAATTYNLNNPNGSSIPNMLPMPNNLGAMKMFPTPYEYALLSNHVYRDDIQVGDKVDNLDGWEVCADLLLDTNHPLIGIFNYFGFSYGYKGRIYKNSGKKQMVLAHRGTEPSNISDITTDINSIAYNNIGGQECLTIDLVAQALTEVEKEGMESLSFTGHSLGGWLAQISLFVFLDDPKEELQRKYPNLYKKLYVKAVTFDTPGARPMLEKMNGRNDPLRIDHLDITNYLSSPNLVNCCNLHVGTLYRVVFKRFSILPGRYTLDSHTIDNFVEAFDPHTKDAKKCLFMRSWPKLDKEHLKNTFSNLLNGNIILNALCLLKDCVTGAVAGKEYEGFFKLAQQTTTHVEPQDLTGKGSFCAAYKYHYKSCKPNYARFYRRHIAGPIFRPLKNMLPTTLSHFQGLQEESQDDIFILASHIDSRLFLDALMQKGPKWLTDQRLGPAPVVKRKRKRKDNLLPLPHRDEYIIKRTATLEALHRNFQQQPMQAIIGYGGVGKTTLARLYADAYFDPKSPSYYDYVWWFHAEDKTALEESIGKICNMMDSTSNDKCYPETGMKKIKEKLQTDPNTRWLLIFDNVKQPQDIRKYLPEAIQRGHILITSRNATTSSWKKKLGQNCTVTPVDFLSEEEAITLLDLHHTPEDNEEKKAQEDLLRLLDEFCPLALSQIGHYISREYNDYSEKEPYQKYYQKYKETNHKLIDLLKDKKLKLSDGEKNYINRSIVNTFENTLKKIKEEMKSEENKDKLGETLHILQVASFLHSDGLDWSFLQYLRCSKKGNFFKGLFQDGEKWIKKSKAKETVDCLRDYGLLLDQGIKCRTHRTIQSIMRWKIKNDKNKNLLTYIEEQALDLLETIQQEMHTITHLTIDQLRFSMAAHCHTLMGHLTHDECMTQDKKKKYKRLLHLMSRIDQLTYLKDQKLYLPPQAAQKGDLHQQVLKFINTTHTNYNSQKKWFSKQPYTPLLLIQGDAGTGKSTYATYLVQQLWKTYLTSKIWAHIPLFISLPEFCTAGQIPTNIIELALAKNGIGESVIKQIKSESKSDKQPWVFIFDGYDEIKSTKNLFIHCNLEAWGTSYSKYIISCRTTYLAELGQTLRSTLFKDHNKNKAEKLEITSYTQDQIASYVDKFAMSSYNLYKSQGWNKARYQKALAQLPALKKWMTTPFLLVVGMQAIPRIVAAQRANTPLSPTTIYKAFVEEWLHREGNKPQHNITKDKLLIFCEELGYTLWKQGTTTLTKADKTMTSFFEKTYALQSAPLRYLGNNRYMFIHKDFQDFFAASFIFKNIAKNKLASDLPSFNLNIKHFFLHHKDTLLHYLNPVQQVPSIAVRNSVQILYWAGHQDFRNANLTKLDLSGINLIKAKLPKKLSYTNLSEATLPQELSGIIFLKATLPQDLSGTNLTHANLSNTDLTNVKLPKDLSYTNLSEAILPKDLSKHNLTHTNLSRTNLTNVKLPKDLSYTILSRATLPQDLSNHNLTHAHLSFTNLSNVKLPKDLSNTDLRKATLPKDLSNHNLTHTNLSYTNLTNVKLPKELSYISLRKATLPKDLSNHYLIHADLSHTNLTNIKLPKDLSHTNLSGATLPQDLCGTNLSRATLPKDLSTINLTGADLSHTNLTNVKFPKNLSKTNLSGAKLPKYLFSINLNGANLSWTNLTNVKLPKDLSHTNLCGATLPKDLSHKNLSGAILPKDLSNINLNGANLTYVQLDSTTLNRLTCDYQQCFQDQVKANELIGGSWYRNNLPKDLKSIAQTYPLLSKDSHKAELVQIASGLAYLPCWANIKLDIKVYYWSCKLLLLKKELSSNLRQKLVVSLEDKLNYDAENCCWKTDYPQSPIEEAKEAPNNDFDQYLQAFQEGLQKHNCQSKHSWGYNWYKSAIEKNIQGLQKTYSKLTSPKLQKEAVDIAFQLSKTYQNQHLLLLSRYFSLQNRLIQLKMSTEVEAGNDIHYNHRRAAFHGEYHWIRGCELTALELESLN